MKLAILSLFLCIAALAQSLHQPNALPTKSVLSTGYAPHPSGTKLIVRQGTNEIVLTRRWCKGRQSELLHKIQVLQEQLEVGRKWLRDYPPAISRMVAEMEDVTLRIKIMDSMDIGDDPSPPLILPPLPPGDDPLPLNKGVQSGLPASLIVR